MSSRPTLLLLPGLTCDATVWSAQVRALSRACEIIVPQWGLLDDLAAMARCALALTDRSRLWVAGHSMGGRVALEMWRKAPQRIAGLALLDTGTQALPAGRSGEVERRLRMRLLRIAKRQGMRAMAQVWAHGMVHPAHHGGAVWDAVVDMLARSSAAQYAAQITALLHRPDAWPLLADLNCPTLVLCGAQDSWSPPQQHRLMAREIPSADYVEISDCGHMSPMEQADAVSSALHGWMGRNKPKPSDSAPR